MGIKTGIFEMFIKLFKSDIQQLKNNNLSFYISTIYFTYPQLLLQKLFYCLVKKLLLQSLFLNRK